MGVLVDGDGVDVGGDGVLVDGDGVSVRVVSTDGDLVLEGKVLEVPLSINIVFPVVGGSK